MAFHHNFPSRTTGARSPNRTDDDEIKRIEKENFNLRRQLEERNKAINALRENYSKQQNDLADTKAKNQLLEKKSIDQEAEINKTQRLFVSACKKRDPHALNQKLEEINGKLQDTEEELTNVKNENQNLKRKLDDDHSELKRKRLKLSEKCTKLYQCKNDLKIEQEKCTEQGHELVRVHDTLKTTKEKLTELEGKRDSQIKLIKTQNECIRELKSQVTLLEPALQEKQRQEQSLEESQKLTQDLEHAIQNCKSKTKKLQNRNYNLAAKLKRKQTELDGNLAERNHLFKFAQDVGILIQFPLSSSSPLQTQLPEIFAHLKDTLQIGGCIYQYQQQNQQPPTPQHISVPPSASSPLPPPQNPSNEEYEGDQLFDEFTSKNMMNIRFPLPSSSPQPSTSTTTTTININSHTVEGCIVLPQPSNKAAETTAIAGNSQDSLFKEIMSNVHQSANQTKLLMTRVNKAKKAKAPPLAKRTVTVTTMTQTKKHVEDKSKRKKGRGKNCEGGAKYFCVCGAVETSLARFKIHIVQFNLDRKFKCDFCPNRFLSLGVLKNHLRNTHHVPNALDEFVLGCGFCGGKFKTREEHRQHKISAHTDSASTNPVENETKSISADMEMATTNVPTTTVAAAPDVQVQPPQPNNVSRRVPSVCMDLEDEEVDVET